MAAAGALLLVRGAGGFGGRLARAEDDDNDDSSGRGRGRGRGRGGDDDGDNSGHGGGDDDDRAEGVPVTGQVPAGSAEVRIVSEDADGFQPRELTVDVGQSVSFVNTQDDEHTATGSGFDTGVIDRGEVVTVVLDTPGVFAYACQFHPVMTGTISVRGADGVVPQPATQTAASADAVPVRIVNLSFDPATAMVATGSAVVWTNDDAVPHTVTATDGAFDSGIFDPGSSFTWTFDQPGTFPYACQLHPQMQGTVTVEGEAVAAPVEGPAAEAGTAEQAAEAPQATPTAQEATPVAPGTSEEPAVSIVDFAFEPETLEVAAGTSVTWTNAGEIPHTATSADSAFDSGVLDSGQIFSHTFDDEGTFPYSCAIHPNMTGTIVVAAGAVPGG
jgi:plastocyanin